LPIHQPPRDEKLLDRIDALLLHDKLIVDHIKHFYDAIETDHTLGNTGKKAISAQVIHPVDIKLTGYQLVEKSPRIAVIENLDRQIEASHRCLIQFIHHERGEQLVRYAFHQGMLKRV